MVFYLKNTDTDRNLNIHHISISSVLTGLFKLHFTTGTAAGTTVTASNLNLSSGKIAGSTSLGNAAVTGTTAGSLLGILRVPATDTRNMTGLSESLILGFGDAISIVYTGAGASIVDIMITGYFEDASL